MSDARESIGECRDLSPMPMAIGNPWPRRVCRLLLPILGLVGTLRDAGASTVAPDDTDPVQATLIAESPTLTPGGSVRLGLRLLHAPHWHTYWLNPGDSGLATRLRFTLPAGYSVDDVVWPVPTRFDVGGLDNFGYSGDILLPVRLHVPANAKPGDSASIGVEAVWLMCRDQCFPGKSHLSVILPVLEQAAEPNSAFAELFARATEGMSKDAPWQAQARVRGESVVVTVIGNNLPRPEGLDAFVQERKLVGYASPEISSTVDGIQLVFPKSDYFSGAPSQMNVLLVRATGVPRAWHVIAPINLP